MKEKFFALIILITLAAIPYLLVSYKIDNARAITVAGYNSPDLDPGVWFVSNGAWDFQNADKETNRISIKEGEDVTLYLTSLDVAHGFYLPAFNISEMMYPGQVKAVKFVASESGEFPFYCNVRSCGFGHIKMNGTLSVTE